MTPASIPPVRLWAMPTAELTEDDVAAWLDVLDDTERSRVARLAIPRTRIEYASAHALTRAMLSAASGEAPTAFRYEIGFKGKPRAFIGDRPLDLHFNISHTDGLVAVAVSRHCELGIDVEAVDRSVDLAVADRYFFGAEADWLAVQPRDRQLESFLRLWTLKEAYIKATGRGLSQPLDEFWFDVDPPRIRFTPAIDDDERAWRFHQRVLADRFMVSAGWRSAGGVDLGLVVEMKRSAELF
jgi:4'-phosphopantetheinyl transferase